MYDATDVHSLQTDISSRASEGESGVASLYTRLRTMILNGHFPPGATLSQVKLAEMLGVSRIPLREALRMLQNEGLIEAEHNQRARVPSFEPAIVDSLYASRILLEALCIRLTIPHFTDTDIHDLKYILTELDEAASAASREDLDLDRWEVSHRRFHRLLVSHVEDSMRQRIASYADQCEYYRRLYYRLLSRQSTTRSADVIAAEHHAIANACIEGNADKAAYLLTRHYARTALTVLGQMTPEFNPIAVRMALQIAGSDTSPSEVPPSRRKTRRGQEAQEEETKSP